MVIHAMRSRRKLLRNASTRHNAAGQDTIPGPHATSRLRCDPPSSTFASQ